MSDASEETALSQNDKIELAKALLAVKSIASLEQYDKVKSILVMPADSSSVDRAIHGLSKEDEFAFMCRLIGTATHLAHLEQRPIIKGEFLVPDFLGRFQPGCTPQGKKSAEHSGYRCLIEVKSTAKDEFKIGGKRLRSLRAFAAQFNLPLLFAVRFLRFDDHALWVIIEDDLLKTALTVTYDGLTTGVRNVIWDDYSFIVYPWIHFRAIYDTTAAADTKGILHSKYGRQVEFHIVSDSDHPFSGPNAIGNSVQLSGIDALTFFAFFEGFALEEVDVCQQGSRTIQLLRPTVSCSVADLLYIFNRLPRDSQGRALLDPSRILTGANSDTGIIDRPIIESIARQLWHSVLGMLTFGEPEIQFAKWQRLGGSI